MSFEDSPALRRIGVDVGGTFTDVFVWDEATSRATVHKLPSTPADPSAAALQGVLEAAAQAGLSLADIDQVFHGTTLATNIVLQHNGARVGFITTHGYRDILHTARHKKPHAFSIYQDLPWQSRPIVPRRYRLPVAGRIGSTGEELVPLDEQAVERAAVRLRDAGVDAIAIGFLFSFLEPRHEQRAKEICERVAPGLFVCTSAEVLPQFREYERFSTTTLNAYVGPAVKAYIGRMDESLRTAGVGTELHLMNSAGGVMTADGAAERPAALLMSGPVAGVLGGIWAGRLSGLDSVITLDVGGTSADIGVAPHGELRMKHILDSSVAGYHTMMPTADCDTIGAGGGSIAFVDEGGVLRVGPRSAGADPGPACYRRGGLEPTVTDAKLVLGQLLPDGLLGGAIPLDRSLAAAAIEEHVARPLGLSIEEAALGIVEIVTENMVAAITTNSTRKGLDPRDFSLVAVGGAGPLFGCDIAARMEIPLVLIPPHPGLTAALGLLASDVVYEYGTTVLRGDRAVGVTELAAEYARLEAEADARFDSDGVPAERRRLQRAADCRYEGQGYELRVECPEGTVDEAWLEAVLTRFHEVHEREYYRSASDRPVQIVNVRVRGIGLVRELDWPELERTEPAAPEAVQRAWFRVDGTATELATPFYQRDELGRGQIIEGPAVIRQFETTTVIPPGCTATVDRYGSLLAEVATATTRPAPAIAAGRRLRERDPVTFQVLGGAFDAIAQEMAAVQIRMSYSGIIRESEDMGAGIFDRTGREICESHTSPMHIGSLPWYIRGVRQTWEDDFQEGDVVLHNHPYKGASHSPDAAIMMPIFWEGELIAFSAVTGHMLDLGGAAPGLNMDVVDVWAENKLYDGLKIYEAGKLNTELWRHILQNTRVPVENRGDFEAMIAACGVGKARFLALLERYGREIVFEAAEEWMDYSELMLRREIEKIPDGTYRSPTGWLDDNGRDRGKPLRLECAVTVAGSEITIDLTGSERESPTSYNAPFEGGTQVAAYYIVRTILLDDAIYPVHVPQNEGIFRPIKVIAPLGTIYNPSFPRACSGRFMKCERICDNVVLALSEPLPERTGAGNGAVCHAIAYSGFQAERGQYWVYIEINESSYGGRFGKDGLDSVDSLLVNTRNNPIEELEMRYPLRVETYELRTEAPAAGRWRGGIGIVRETRFLEPGYVSSEADRHFDPPRGVYGGQPGVVATMARKHEGTLPETLPALLTGVEFAPGDVLRIVTPSSGGYGDPLEREPDAVARDVIDEFLTADQARADYAVVLNGDGSVDEAATMSERRSRTAG